MHPLSICTWEEAEVLQLKMSQQRARGKLDERLSAESYLASATISICPGVRSNALVSVTGVPIRGFEPITQIRSLARAMVSRAK